MQSNAARAGLLAALVAVAVVLFIALSGGDDSDSDADKTTTEPAATAATPAQPAEPEVFEIQLRDGGPVGGVGEFEVTKGETVRIAIRTDQDAELHVHGYELEDELTAGEVTRLEFPADIDGKFEIEAHSQATGDIPLGELTVQPG